VAVFDATSGGEPVTAVRWGRNHGLYVAAADGALGSWSLDGRCVASLETGLQWRAMEVDVWADRDVLALGGADGSLRLWVGEEGGGVLRELLCVPHAHRDAVTCLDVDWGRGRLVTGSVDASMRVWRAAGAGGVRFETVTW
jgi:WD40 repeat protein